MRAFWFFSSNTRIAGLWLRDLSLEAVRKFLCAYVWGTSGARCPYGDVFLRLRASEAKRRSLYCSAFTSVLVFFSRDIPSAFVLIEGYFLRAYFSATMQTFQKETQLDALSNRVKTFRNFSIGAILLASKARNFRKFFGFLSILLFFANHSELPRCRY